LNNIVSESIRNFQDVTLILMPRWLLV